MIRLTDIHSLSDFQRNSKQFIKRLKKTGQPEILTVNGKATLVIQDAKSYQKLLDDLDHLEAVEGIRRGLEDVAAGRTRPATEVLEELRRKYKIPKHVAKAKKPTKSSPKPAKRSTPPTA